MLFVFLAAETVRVATAVAIGICFASTLARSSCSRLARYTKRLFCSSTTLTPAQQVARLHNKWLRTGIVEDDGQLRYSLDAIVQFDQTITNDKNGLESELRTRTHHHDQVLRDLNVKLSNASDREEQLKQEKRDQVRRFDQEKRDQAKQLESTDLLLRNKIVLLDSVKLENAQLDNAKERAEQSNKSLREELADEKATATYMSTELDHLRSPMSAQKTETDRLSREVSQLQEQLNTKNEESGRLERQASKLRGDLSNCRQQLLRQRGVMLRRLRAAGKTANREPPRHSSTDPGVDSLPLSTADEMADSQGKQRKGSAMEVDDEGENDVSMGEDAMSVDGPTPSDGDVEMALAPPDEREFNADAEMSEAPPLESVPAETSACQPAAATAQTPPPPPPRSLFSHYVNLYTAEPPSGPSPGPPPGPASAPAQPSPPPATSPLNPRQPSIPPAVTSSLNPRQPSIPPPVTSPFSARQPSRIPSRAHLPNGTGAASGHAPSVSSPLNLASRSSASPAGGSSTPSAVGRAPLYDPLGRGPQSTPSSSGVRPSPSYDPRSISPNVAPAVTGPTPIPRLTPSPKGAGPTGGASLGSSTSPVPSTPKKQPRSDIPGLFLGARFPPAPELYFSSTPAHRRAPQGAPDTTRPATSGSTVLAQAAFAASTLPSNHSLSFKAPSSTQHGTYPAASTPPIEHTVSSSARTSGGNVSLQPANASEHGAANEEPSVSGLSGLVSRQQRQEEFQAAESAYRQSILSNDQVTIREAQLKVAKAKLALAECGKNQDAILSARVGVALDRLKLAEERGDEVQIGLAEEELAVVTMDKSVYQMNKKERQNRQWASRLTE